MSKIEDEATDLINTICEFLRGELDVQILRLELLSLAELIEQESDE